MAYPAKRKKEKPKKEAKDDIEAAKGLAVRFLSYRSRSSEEVRGKLSGAGFSPAVIEHALARIKELGYLNDYDYAVACGRSCLEHKYWGPSRIRDALLTKGVAPGIIASALQELAREHDFSRFARRALESRFSPADISKPLEKKTRQKAIEFLLRKGFSWDTISDVIDPGYDTFT